MSLISHGRIPIEFYKHFWENIKFRYLEMIRESWKYEILPNSTKTSVISAIHKADEKKPTNKL